MCKRFKMKRQHLSKLAVLAALLVIQSCNQGYTVSINNQAIYDPTGRLSSSQVADPDLQGCINLALWQQDVGTAAELTVLSCANAEISDLGNIAQLSQLRFLDLGSNNVSNITPLEQLKLLGGLNLADNAIIDIGPLFNIASLASVSLLGNDDIPCAQLALLRERLGDNLTPPERCKN